MGLLAVPTGVQPLTDQPRATSPPRTTSQTVALVVGICTRDMLVCMSSGAIFCTPHSPSKYDAAHRARPVVYAVTAASPPSHSRNAWRSAGVSGE